MTDRIPHPAWVEIDMSALTHNARVLGRATPDRTQLGILVKANGYGHGRQMAARAALRGGADRLIVASLDEALALRSADINAPILVCYPVPPAGIPDAVEADLDLSVGGTDGLRRTLEALARHRSAEGRRTRLRLHVEVDTGIGRGGVAAADLTDVAAAIDARPDAKLAGIWSHLADGRDANRSAAQSERFDAALTAVATTGRVLPTRHLLATEGLFAASAPAYDMVRIGLAFYGELGIGVVPAADMAAPAADLRPAMQVKARPVRVETVPVGWTVGYGQEWAAERPSVIATLPIGYGDGWARSSWPGGSALVRGRRAPLVGRVSMDSVCVDVTDVPGITPDDELVLLGGSGTERITPSEVAVLRGTIPNEVFCALGARLPRVYREAGGIGAWSRQDERVERST